MLLDAQDVTAAVAIFSAHLLQSTSPSEVQAEVQGQFDFVCSAAVDNREYTFHHDIDFALTPSHYRPPSGIVSRRDCIEGHMYAGYRHLFLDQHEGVDHASMRFAELLSRALADSRMAGGTPVEVALHPAVDGRELIGLSSYNTSRYVEFCAWRSEAVTAILDRGERIGSRFVFS